MNRTKDAASLSHPRSLATLGIGRAATLGMNLGLALLSGILFALSFPDAAIGWLMFIAVIPLLIAIVKSRSAKEALLLGWIAHTTSWLIMVPWVIRVMSHYGGLPYITGVLIFVAMSIYLGVYGAVFAALVYSLRLDHRLRWWLLVPLVWAAVEYVRTYVFTGFPWNLIATALIDYAPLIQIDRFAGPYFVAALMLFPATVVTWLLTQPASTPKRMFAGAAVVVILFVWWTTGYVSLAITRVQRQSAKAAMLQPNISQEMRWDEQNLIAIFQRMIDMTKEAVRNGAEVIIWPESTVPLSFARTDFYREAVQSISRSAGVDIILGSVAEDPERPNDLWNAAFLVSGGKIIGHYDKIRLVPFGEYVPMRKILFFAEKLVRYVGEFQFGEKDTPLEGKYRYGPAICYEIVYPQITRTQVRHGANVLVTITNDAWYDGTSAPRQHLNMARLRAVEDDRFLLRAGTTGISAFIDPTGRIIEEIPMGRQGILYAKFEARETVKPYVRSGDWFAWVAVAAVIIGMGTRRLRTSNL